MALTLSLVPLTPASATEVPPVPSQSADPSPSADHESTVTDTDSAAPPTEGADATDPSAVAPSSSAPDDTASSSQAPSSPGSLPESTPSGVAPDQRLAPSATTPTLTPGPVYPKSSASILKEPQAGSAPLLSVVAGSQLQRSTVQGAWSKVVYGSVVGWVKTAELDTKNPVTASSTQAFALKRLSLSKSTNTDGAKITVPAGSSLQVTGTARGWERISYAGQSGFVVKGENWQLKPPTKNFSARDRWVASATTSHSYSTPSSSVRRSLLPGTHVRVTGTTGEWSRVDDGAGVGWVLTTTLSGSPSSKSASGTRWARTDVSLRKASDHGATVTTIPIGAKVTLSSTQGVWAKVRYGGSTGYVIASSALSTSIPVKKMTPFKRWAKRDAALRKDTARLPYSASLVKLPVGTRVEVIGRVGPWAQVRYAGKTGYVIESTELSTSIPVRSVKGQARFAAKSVPLRPDTARSPYSKAVATIPAGTKVKITGRVGPWARVSHAGKTGYVMEANDLVRTNRNAFSVYGTLRRGGVSDKHMAGYSQRDASPRIAATNLYFWKKMADPRNDVTVIARGGGSVVQEQYRYSPSKGRSMYNKLDSFESYYKISGIRVYTAQLKSMTDGSISWTFYANPKLETTLKKQSTLVGDGDFNHRRRF